MQIVEPPDVEAATPPREIKAWRLTKIVGSAAVGLALVVLFTTRPEGKYLLDEQCNSTALLSESIWAEEFWKAQRDEIDNRLGELNRLPAEWAAADAMVDRALQDAEQLDTQIYREHPELAPSPIQKQIDRLQATSDQIEDQESRRRLEVMRRAEIADLLRCREVVRRKVRS